MGNNKSWLPFFLIFLCLQSTYASATAPAGKDWFTIKSEHFYVHYHSPLEEYARRFTGNLENALPHLQEDLRWKLPAPVDIVIMDPSDAANGSASNFPNTHMEVYAVPFDQSSALGAYSDWVRELATHELTHLIANDTTRGFYKGLRAVFGSWVKPNGLQAVWLVEGLAVYEETSQTPGGRGRSPLLEALLRTAIRENKLGADDYISLDRFNDGVHWWPAGNVPYLMGYTVQAYTDYLLHGKLNAVPGQLSFENADRMIYMPNSNAKDVTKKDWYEIFDQTIAHLKKRYPKEANKAVSTAPQACQLTHSGRFTGGHALGSDGYVYFMDQNPLHGSSLARMRADSCQTNPAKPWENVERLEFLEMSSPIEVAVSPTSKWVAYTETKVYKLEYIYDDLYLHNMRTGGKTRLTHQERARDPAFLDDNTLLYVHTRQDLRQSIRMRSIETESSREIFITDRFERISGLVAAQGKAYFSVHHNNGIEQIYSIDPHTGSTQSIAPPSGSNISQEHSPFPMISGKILFAGFYGKGTQDIYFYDTTTAQRKLVARSESGFLDRPRVSADNKFLFVANYTLEGTEIFRYPLDGSSPLVQDISLPEEDLHADLTGSPKNEVAQPPVQISKPEPYNVFLSPATSLLPQYWMPQFSGATDGFLVGANTSGNDPLEHHSWYASGNYDSRANFPLYHAYYLNRSFANYFLLDAQQSNNYLAGSQLSQRTAQYSGEVIFPFSNYQISLGAAYQQHMLFGIRTHDYTFYQQFKRDTSLAKPSAIDLNYGSNLQLYAGVIPTNLYENTYFDIRPRASFYMEGLTPAHSVGFSVLGGISTNRYLSSNYFLGGGASSLSSSPYIVRGYPLDSLLGQKMATMNLSYTLPLGMPYHGWGTNPLFLQSYGLRFYLDAGTANYLSRYRGTSFAQYQHTPLGQKILVGTGMDFVTNGTVLYHAPISASLGVHYGAMKNYGGRFLLFLGLNIGQVGSLGSAKQTETN